MKKWLLYCLIFCFLVINSTLEAQSLLPVFKQVKRGESKFRLSTARILISQDSPAENQKTIGLFIGLVKQQTGINLSKTYVKDQSTPLIVINSDTAGSGLPVPDEKQGKQSREYYQIKVTASKVEIEAKSDAALFYALQTLLQLIKTEGTDVYIQEIDLKDYPAFAYRGVMMDFAHGGLLTEEEIKNQIDFLCRWKMNQYYFYNEVSIGMKGYPLINYHAQYSQEQIRRIIAYGSERHIDVIPFVNFYGHLHELLRLEKYAGLGFGKYGHDLDPRIPGVQTILKDWIKQYVELFPSPFIHVGFDETWETERLSVSDSTIAPKEFYLKQLDFVTKILQSYGKTVMVWTDISKNYPDIIAQFPGGVIPVVWDYGDDSASINRWIKPILKERLPFFIQPAVDGWAHIYPTKYTYINIDMCLEAGLKNNAIGYITSVWTDAVQPLLRNSWLFMAYGCSLAWQGSPVEKDEFISSYSKIVYPEIADQMKIAFQKMAESQSYLEKCLRRHTQTEMWTNPFSEYSLQNTNDHLGDYKKARLAAEIALESLINAFQYGTTDTTFIKTLLVNSRLLHYTATRFLWAKTIVDRWNQSVQHPGDDYIPAYNDVRETPHGLIADILDYCTEIKEDYRQAWLSENMAYRLGTMTGRFDEEYLLWRGITAKLVDYHYNSNKDQPAKFEESFIPNR
jgi:hexosaminidase